MGGIWPEAVGEATPDGGRGARGCWLRYKPLYARAVLQRAFAAHVPAAWVTGDGMCVNDGTLR